MFKGYVQPNKRRILCEVDIDVKRALDFLNEVRHGIITDNNDEEYTQEELENVKSFGSKSRIEHDNTVSPVGEIPEDSYRELFGTLGHNTE